MLQISRHNYFDVKRTSDYEKVRSIFSHVIGHAHYAEIKVKVDLFWSPRQAQEQETKNR